MPRLALQLPRQVPAGPPTTRPSLISFMAPSPSWIAWWLHSSREEEEEGEQEAGAVIKAVAAHRAEVQVAAQHSGGRQGED